MSRRRKRSQQQHRNRRNQSLPSSPHVELVCPKHKVRLVKQSTQYGKRWHCPANDCTVACWGGSTSTPADDATRTARHKAHLVFDPLWKKGGIERKELYRLLSEFMGIEREHAHIGMFNIEQCSQVHQFVLAFKCQSDPAAYEKALFDELCDGSIVRRNLLTVKGYAPYCGGCERMERAFWDATLCQFACKCGWVSEFPVRFIEAYLRFVAGKPIVNVSCGVKNAEG